MSQWPELTQEEMDYIVKIDPIDTSLSISEIPDLVQMTKEDPIIDVVEMEEVDEKEKEGDIAGSPGIVGSSEMEKQEAEDKGRAIAGSPEIIIVPDSPEFHTPKGNKIVPVFTSTPNEVVSRRGSTGLNPRKIFPRDINPVPLVMDLDDVEWDRWDAERKLGKMQIETPSLVVINADIGEDKIEEKCEKLEEVEGEPKPNGTGAEAAHVEMGAESAQVGIEAECDSGWELAKREMKEKKIKDKAAALQQEKSSAKYPFKGWVSPKEKKMRIPSDPGSDWDEEKPSDLSQKPEEVCNKIKVGDSVLEAKLKEWDLEMKEKPIWKDEPEASCSTSSVNFGAGYALFGKRLGKVAIEKKKYAGLLLENNKGIPPKGIPKPTVEGRTYVDKFGVTLVKPVYKGPCKRKREETFEESEEEEEDEDAEFTSEEEASFTDGEEEEDEESPPYNDEESLETSEDLPDLE